MASSAPEAAPDPPETTKRVQYGLEFVMEGSPGSEALFARNAALGLHEHVADATSPFSCAVSPVNVEGHRRGGAAGEPQLQIRCGPRNVVLVRQTEQGLALGERVVKLPPGVEMVLSQRQPLPLERDCSGSKPATIRAKLVAKNTPDGVEVRLRVPEVAVDEVLGELGPIEDCWTVLLPRAHRAKFHCVTADHSTLDELWLQDDRLFVASSMAGIDELPPDRWAIQLPCQASVVWTPLGYRGPRSAHWHMPYERALWRCDKRCEEAHHDERGELTPAGAACRQRCMDAYTKARFQTR